MQKVKTPKYWNDEDLQPLVEATTSKGNKVMIPKKFINGWETARLRDEDAKKRGLDPLDGLENIKEMQPMSYDLEKVYFEIYEDED